MEIDGSYLPRQDAAYKAVHAWHNFPVRTPAGWTLLWTDDTGALLGIGVSDYDLAVRKATGAS